MKTKQKTWLKVVRTYIGHFVQISIRILVSCHLSKYFLQILTVACSMHTKPISAIKKMGVTVLSFCKNLLTILVESNMNSKISDISMTYILNERGPWPLFLLQIQVYHGIPHAYTKFEQNISIYDILGKRGANYLKPNSIALTQHRKFFCKQSMQCNTSHHV